MTADLEGKGNEIAANSTSILELISAWNSSNSCEKQSKTNKRSDQGLVVRNFPLELTGSLETTTNGGKAVWGDGL